MSDDAEVDYQVITDNYKSPEGSLQERLTMMSAVREASGSTGSGAAALRFRYPGKKNQDVFLQMINLDKGIYGEPYTIALFIHVIIIFDCVKKMIQFAFSFLRTNLHQREP
jgi:hypothetical protein